MDKDVEKTYGNKVRVRACGICWENDRILMVNHRGITPGDFWAPPGGGVEFGQSIETTLKREFEEETELLITTGKFLFGCELIREPIHAIELFYQVSVRSGSLRRGSDPEIQLITDVRYFPFDELKRIPPAEVHAIFGRVDSPSDLKRLKGFFRI